MTKLTQLRYSAAVQRRAVEQVLIHNQSLAQVAKQFHCSKQSVQRWIDKHRQTHFNTSSLAHTTFLPLQVGNDFSLPHSPTIEFTTQTGLTLRFPVSTPTETLCGIIQQLERASC